MAAVPAVRAQTVSLDEGSFRLSVGGQEVGTETFSIRQNGTGDNAIVIAQGRVALDKDGRGAEELNASLELAGAALRPAAYQINVQGGQSQKIAGRIAGGRFSARIISPAGEMMREYLASDGAVLVDEGVAHQYYFLARKLGANKTLRVAVIIPRESRQLTAQVDAQGQDRIQVGGKTVEAHRISVTVPGTPERQLWIDDNGRVLRLEIPSRKYLAERSALP